MGLFSDLSFLGGGAVKKTKELERIVALPRRGQLDIDLLVETMTAFFRKPGGEQVLRPMQALALCELMMRRGLFAPMPVGSGKTLVSLLAAVAIEAVRPVLLVPASLKEKTRRDKEELDKHWRLPENLEIVGYEWLSQSTNRTALLDYEPDLIIADEAHKLKNLRSARANRVKEYMRKAPDTAFVAMSGSMTKSSIMDYAHFIRWALGEEERPLPNDPEQLETWARALDHHRGGNAIQRGNPGALSMLCDDEELNLWRYDRHKAARLAYRRRLQETVGVVASFGTSVEAALNISACRPQVPSEITEPLGQLRAGWELPNGEVFDDPVRVQAAAKQLALGMYYIWDPPAPAHWLQARKIYSAFVRDKIARSPVLDTELLVRRRYAESPEVLDWLAVKDDFTINTVPTWISEEIVHWCANWGQKNPGGIIWTEHVFFAEKLAEVSGFPYFGQKGIGPAGLFIDDADPKQTIIASIASNCTGRNLQNRCRNLITSMPSSGVTVEQLLGRTHREGQEEDEVLVDVLITAVEQQNCFWAAVSEARYAHQSTGAPQKILLATVVGMH